MAKKVLFVTYDFPWPTTSGGKSRIYNLMKFSKSRDLEFYLYSFTRPTFKKSYKTDIAQIGVDKIYTHPRKSTRDPLLWTRAMVGNSSVFKLLYFDKKIEEELVRIIKNEGIEIVVFESFYVSFYISDIIKNLGVKQIFGSENIEHVLYYDFAKEKGILKNLYMSQVAKVRKEEETAYRSSDTVLAVTPDEKEYIEAKTKTSVVVMPNGVDTKNLAYKFHKETSGNLLFVGNFSYFPNIDAMKFFYYEVFKYLTNTTLTIIGKHQERLGFLKNDKRINCIEYVEDIRDSYYNADVFIFPVRFGGGTNFKILEAASCGTPIIAIPDRVKGIGFTPDKHYVPASTSAEFIEGIEKLLTSKKLRDTISKNAREIMEKEYDWKEIGKKMNEVFLLL